MDFNEKVLNRREIQSPTEKLTLYDIPVKFNDSMSSSRNAMDQMDVQKLFVRIKTI